MRINALLFSSFPVGEFKLVLPTERDHLLSFGECSDLHGVPGPFCSVLNVYSSGITFLLCP